MQTADQAQKAYEPLKVLGPFLTNDLTLHPALACLAEKFSCFK